MSSAVLALRTRPVMVVGNRRYVILEDLKSALGTQLVAAADITDASPPESRDEAGRERITVWYEGAGICHVLTHGEPDLRPLPVVDLPLRIDLDIQSGLSRLLSAP